MDEVPVKYALNLTWDRGAFGYIGYMMLDGVTAGYVEILTWDGVEVQIAGVAEFPLNRTSHLAAMG